MKKKLGLVGEAKEGKEPLDQETKVMGPVYPNRKTSNASRRAATKGQEQKLFENEPKLFESMPHMEPGTTTTIKVRSMKDLWESVVKRHLKGEEKTAKQMIEMI